MSLHKFAEQVASQGRGDDSLLVHMTPDEVRNLQQFAQANGTTLTINPTTGLPEAGMLSDLFKAIAPIALGAFLGPAGLGMSSMMAGVATGGITTLATGSLSRGLMAGLGAYGGAGLGESLMTAGGGMSAANAATTAQQQLSGANLALGEAMPAQAAEQFTKDAVTRMTPSGAVSAGFNKAIASPTAALDFAKSNMGNLAYAAAPIAAGLMVPTTTKMPNPKDTGYIRQMAYNINPDTGMPDPLYGKREMTPIKASEFGDKTFKGQRDLFYQQNQNQNPYQLGVGSLNQPPQQQLTGMAGGGIVALASGGVPGYAEGDLIREAYERGDYGAANQLIADAGLNAQDVVNQYGLNQAEAADVAKNLGYTGDMSGTQYGAGLGTTVNDLYKQVLGRDVESEGAAGYWQNKFGDSIDANELAEFKTAAQAEIDARNTGNAGNANAGLAALNTGITGSSAPAYTDQYTYANINDYIANNNLDATGIAAAAKQFNVDPAQVTAAQNAQSVVSNVFRNVLGRDPDPNGLDYWTNQIMTGNSTGQEMLDTFIKNAKANNEIIANPNIKLDDAVKAFGGYKSSNARDIADEWVRNTLGREVTEADRKQQWYKDAVNDAVMNTYGKAQDIYGGFKTYAQGEATTATTKAINDAKATLAARGLTEADVVKQTGKTIAQLVAGGTNLGLDLYQASQLKAPGAASKFNFNTISKAAVVPPVVPPTSVIPGGFYGRADGSTPGDITTNPDGTVTVTPNIPYRPDGGFSGMGEVKDAYTKGGGSLGYTSPVVKTPAEHEAAYNKLTDDSLDAYNFLMGKGKNLTQRKAETRDRPVMQRYDEAVLGRKITRPTKTTTTTKTVTGTPGQPQTFFNETEYLTANPDVAAELKTGKANFTSAYEHYLMYGKREGRKFAGDYEGYLTAAALADAANAGGGGGPGNDGGGGGGGTGGGGTGGNAAGAASAAGGGNAAPGTGNASTSAAATSAAASAASVGVGDAAASGGRRGGQVSGYAMGGGLGSLGSYSDGGRLLKGPGDGVSDSIPATIGAKNQPARLADGEFVIPARIVSELGNGSTDAGAKKLYAMMDRVQRARGKTTGKNKVAANSRSDKYLPA
jgi:hypothetical protein